MAHIVKAYSANTVLFKEFWEVRCHVAGPDDVALRIDAHKIRPLPIVLPVERLFILFVLFSVVQQFFPNILFAKDGEIYELAGKRCVAIGGAYSVDMQIRLAENLGWWEDEQPSIEIKTHVEQQLEQADWNVDIVLSHTCPMKYIPREVFLSGIDQSSVDNRTEEWLDTVEERLTYSRWYCGHYHTNNAIDKMRFLFEDFLEVR